MGSAAITTGELSLLIRSKLDLPSGTCALKLEDRVMVMSDATVQHTTFDGLIGIAAPTAMDRLVHEEYVNDVIEEKEKKMETMKDMKETLEIVKTMNQMHGDAMTGSATGEAEDATGSTGGATGVTGGTGGTGSTGSTGSTGFTGSITGNSAKSITGSSAGSST